MTNTIPDADALIAELEAIMADKDWTKTFKNGLNHAIAIVKLYVKPQAQGDSIHTEESERERGDYYKEKYFALLEKQGDCRAEFEKVKFEIVEKDDLLEIRQIINTKGHYRLVARFDAFDRDMAEAAIKVWHENNLGNRWKDPAAWNAAKEGV